MYEECGYGYLKEHFCSNYYNNIPEPTPEGSDAQKANKKSKTKR